MTKRPALLLIILAFSFVASAAAPRHQTRSIEGWTVHIDDRLLTAEEKSATEAALVLLRAQLKEIVRVVPAGPTAQLRKVKLWLSPPYPHAPQVGEYHPSDMWLSQNGRNPAMAKGVEFTNIRIFEPELKRMPSLVLHELAHAYHDQVLGYENAEIIAAYQRAVESKSYERVERWHGPWLPSTFERAYAITHVRDYFAETTEAFFGRNDYYPFTREELTKHDPVMAALLPKLWRVSAPPPAPPPLPMPELSSASAPFSSRCFYRLTTQWQGDGMSLDIHDDGKANNTPFLARTGHFSGQMWQLTPVANGAYRLTTQWRGTGLSLAFTEGGRPLLVDTATVPEQAWKVVPLGNGFHRLTTQAQGDGLSLDIVNDGRANNTLIFAKTGNVSGQMWKLSIAGCS
jgi:hypothetical protein